jgi:hypothetical protein
MMPALARKIGEAIVRRSTRAQALPLKVDDPRTVDTLAEMFGPPRRQVTSQSEGRGASRPGLATPEGNSVDEAYPAATTSAT